MIWKITTGLSAVAVLAAVYGISKTGQLTPTETLMFLLGNVLLYFFNKYIISIYKELVLAVSSILT